MIFGRSLGPLGEVADKQRVTDKCTNPPGANPLVAERAFCASDYLEVTRVSHV